MLSDRLLDSLALVKLQAAVADGGLLNVALGLLAVVATVVVADYAHMLYLRSKMPPGPFPLPIIGNTFSLPDKKPWIYFEELSKQYKTPLITYWIGRYVASGSSGFLASRNHNTDLLQKPHRLDQRCLVRARNLREEGANLRLSTAHGRLR
jgi:hypothetical protein